MFTISKWHCSVNFYFLKILKHSSIETWWVQKNIKKYTLIVKHRLTLHSIGKVSGQAVSDSQSCCTERSNKIVY